MTLCAVLALGMSAQAEAMTRDEYAAAKDRIEAEHEAAMALCNGLEDRAKDACKSQADGKEAVAEAELEAQHKPTARQRAEVIETKADVAYDMAKQKCDALGSAGKDVCLQDAKSVHKAARGQASAE